MDNIIRREKKRKRRKKRSVRMTKERRRKQLMRRAILSLSCAVIGIVVFILLGDKILDLGRNAQEVYSQIGEGDTYTSDWKGAPQIDVQLLDVNEYSRPGSSLEKVNGIVIHYIGNPATSAQANRDYFNALKDAHTTKASSHFIVGLEGEIIQCVPTSEISYASNERNKDTIAIECCHPDESGQFNQSTYQSMVDLTGWLCLRYGLSSQEVIRHHDVTGKICPKYFVENEEAWENFKQDVGEKIIELKNSVE